MLPLETSEVSLGLLLVLAVGTSASCFDAAIGLEKGRRSGARSGIPRRANGSLCLKVRRNGYAPDEMYGFEVATGRQESGRL